MSEGIRKYCYRCVLECYKEGIDVKEQYKCKKGEICDYCNKVSD